MQPDDVTEDELDRVLRTAGRAFYKTSESLNLELSSMLNRRGLKQTKDDKRLMGQRMSALTASLRFKRQFPEEAAQLENVRNRMVFLLQVGGDRLQVEQKLREYVQLSRLMIEDSRRRYAFDKAQRNGGNPVLGVLLQRELSGRRY